MKFDSFYRVVSFILKLPVTNLNTVCPKQEMECLAIQHHSSCNQSGRHNLFPREEGKGFTCIRFKERDRASTAYVCKGCRLM